MSPIQSRTKQAVGHQAGAPGTDGDTSMNVHFPNSTSNRGTPIAVDDMQHSSSGDVALAHLNEPAPVDQYMPLADSYDATAGDSGVIDDYGLRATLVPTSGLYKADVSILGESTDAYGGRAIHLEGADGPRRRANGGRGQRPTGGCSDRTVQNARWQGLQMLTRYDAALEQHRERIVERGPLCRRPRGLERLAICWAAPKSRQDVTRGRRFSRGLRALSRGPRCSCIAS